MTILQKNRLKKNSDFLRVFRGKTKRFEAAFGKIIITERSAHAARFGFVISKKILSRSTARNLLKRRASEWAQKHLFLFRDGFDAVFVFEKGAVRLSRRALYEELERACRGVGLFKY